MGEKTKPCPKCNGTMGYRLGEYTCDMCGHVESSVPEQPAAKGSSGPGFKRDQRWSNQPPSPPPVYGAAPPPPGTLYKPGQIHAGGHPGIGEAGEKPISVFEYIFAGCLAFFIPIVGLAFAWHWSQKNRPGAESCMAAAWLWFGLNVVFIILALLFGSR